MSLRQLLVCVAAAAFVISACNYWGRVWRSSSRRRWQWEERMTGSLRRARGGHVVFKNGWRTDSAGSEQARRNRCKQAAACETQTNISKTCRANERGWKYVWVPPRLHKQLVFFTLSRRLWLQGLFFFSFSCSFFSIPPAAASWIAIYSCLFSLLTIEITFFYLFSGMSLQVFGSIHNPKNSHSANWPLNWMQMCWSLFLSLCDQTATMI